MKHVNKFLLLAMFVGALSSCKKDDDDDQDESTITTEEVTLSRKTTYGEDWVYFSFSTGAEVSGVDDSNYQTNSTWDIAFNRFNVRTNGGTSGAGQAAAFDASTIGFATANEAPAAGYTEDTSIQIVESLNTPNPPTMIASNGSTVFVGNIVLDTSNPPPTYTPNDHIYYVKTNDGKYAKIWIKSFFNAQGDSGYVNFKYSYQADGSRTFE